LNLADLNFNQDLIIDDVKIQAWKAKELHGRFINQLNQQGIECCASNKWLNYGQLYPETEGFMIAIQDQVIEAKNYRTFILKDSTLTNDLCRRCNDLPETIQHITSACGIHAPQRLNKNIVMTRWPKSYIKNLEKYGFYGTRYHVDRQGC
jgi:hypothetical protein